MRRLYRFLLVVTVAVAVPVHAQTAVTLEILDPTPRPQDGNYRLADTTGFSASFVIPDEYRVFGTRTTQRLKWKSSLDGFQDLFSSTSLCSQTADPQTWDGRCLDAIGLFWKNRTCTNGEPCEWNGKWNAAPGLGNMSIFPQTWLWPSTSYYGSPGFTPILNKDAVNNVNLLPSASSCATGYPCPPKSGQEATCNPHNPDSYATGVANAKAVQVYYAGGVNRWFMAFNKQVHYENSYSDKWRVLWAYSDDGFNWTVHPQVLFRSQREATGSFCGLGLIVSDLFLDTGYFYMTVTDVFTSNVYLFRSRIDNPGTLPGYVGTWSVASYPLVGGNWTWKNVQLGSLLDLPGMNAANVFPNPTGGDSVPKIRQSDIGRVFVSSTPNSSSRYVGLASDIDNGQQVLQLFLTTSLNKPFTYQSAVDLSPITIGGNGLEFAFTQYHDNLPSSPRLVSGELDFWIVQQQPDATRPWDFTRTLTLSRKTAKIRGGIFPN